MKRDFVIEIPQDIQEMNKNKGLITVDYLNQWEDYKNRRIYLNAGIDDFSLDVITYYISKYNDMDKDLSIEDREPIKIYINSDGGGLYEGMHIVDVIKLSKTPVWTICQSRVYSSGGIIFVAGHKRFCHPSSSFLLHSGNIGLGGRTDSVFDNIEFSKQYEKRVKDLFVDNTKITSEQYDSNYRREWFMDSDEMIKLGIADEVCEEIIF